MRILWLANVPSPYRVDFFNELGKQCELTVLFEKKTSDERDKSWLNYSFQNFKGILLRGKSINTDSAICPEVVAYVKDKSYDHIVVTNISSPTGVMAISYMRIHNIPYWIEGDGGFARLGNGVRNRLKTYMISAAKGCFSTSKAHDEYYLAYGATEEKIYRYPFTSLKEHDLFRADDLRYKKDSLRDGLGINEDCVVISVGQFVPRKGFDVLLRAASLLDSNVGVYIIGGVPTDEYKQIIQEYRLESIHFVGFESKEELGKYYAASDIFVLPTREDIWGLVINEAMAYSLPIITTNRCVAGLELVKNGENGYIIPTDDYAQLAYYINGMIMDRKYEQFGDFSRKLINDYTIEQMVKTHMTIFSRRVGCVG